MTVNQSKPDGDESRPNELELYFDGKLHAAPLAELKKKIESDARLRSEVECQRRINASLRRQFAVPDAQTIMEPAPSLNGSGQPSFHTIPRLSVVAQPAAHRSWFSRRWLAAAALVVVSVAGVWAWMMLNPTPVTPVEPPTAAKLTLDRVYAIEQDRRWNPAWKCENPAQFAGTFKQRLGQALLIPWDDSPMLGLSYTTVFGPHGTLFLAKVGESHILVVIDRLALDPNPPPAVPADSKLHVHRRVVGSLVLYEVSPLDQPKILDLFFVPDPSVYEALTDQPSTDS